MGEALDFAKSWKRSLQCDGQTARGWVGIADKMEADPKQALEIAQSWIALKVLKPEKARYWIDTAQEGGIWVKPEDVFSFVKTWHEANVTDDRNARAWIDYAQFKDQGDPVQFAKKYNGIFPRDLPSYIARTMYPRNLRPGEMIFSTTPRVRQLIIA